MIDETSIPLLSDQVDVRALQLLHADQAWHYRVVPWCTEEEVLVVGIDEQAEDQEQIKEELELLLGLPVALKQVSSDMLEKSLAKHYRRPASAGLGSPDLPLGNSQGELLELLQEAKLYGSSDVHIEPFEHFARVRFRIDGKLIEKFRLGKEDYPGLINQLKIRSKLDIAEKRLPQDGRIFLDTSNWKLDVRVSTLPTLHGEKIVLRLLADHKQQIELTELGFQEAELRRYLEGVQRPNGLILISGPTGSGKTTTLYGTLQLLNQPDRNILTIEDPIEYTLEGINQVQLKESIGLHFASALRTFLRQDPDIIMVGEIRDLETAQMAVRASMTGHLVLSTIHTNSAWGIVSRLMEMGVPPFLLADTLSTVVAQRLVRRLCAACKHRLDWQLIDWPDSVPADVRPDHCYIPQGCEQCFFTGYSGRIAVYEVIRIDADLAQCIKKEDLDTGALLRQAGVRSLALNGMSLLRQGETSWEEIAPIWNVQS